MDDRNRSNTSAMKIDFSKGKINTYCSERGCRIEELDVMSFLSDGKSAGGIKFLGNTSKQSTVQSSSAFLPVMSATVEKEPPEGMYLAKKFNLMSFPENVQAEINTLGVDMTVLQDNYMILLQALDFLHNTQFDFAFVKDKPPNQAGNVDFFDMYKNVAKNTSAKKSLKVERGYQDSKFAETWIVARLNKNKERVLVKDLVHKTRGQRKKNMAELSYCIQMDSPFILKYKASFFTDDKESLWICHEYMDGGSLAEALKKVKFNEDQIAYMAREILKGLKYLHENNICHRDLHSNNILVNNVANIKIANFGCAFNVQKEKLNTMCGKPHFIPPEMMLLKYHTPAVDIWAFGMVCVEMQMQSLPYQDNPLKCMYEVGTNGLRPWLQDNSSAWSDDFSNFLLCALAYKPEDRMSSSRLLSHPFLFKASSDNTMKEILCDIWDSRLLG